jgi:hypothetical protein
MAKWLASVWMRTREKTTIEVLGKKAPIFGREGSHQRRQERRGQRSRRETRSKGVGKARDRVGKGGEE